MMVGLATAQDFRFNQVQIEGNQRVEPATILSYANIARGEAVSAGDLNDAFQNIQESGLFEEVELIPSGSTLIIRVQEFPTINRINIEGNRRIDDEDLLPLLRSQPRRVYSPTLAEQDAATLTEAYTTQGRLAATVSPSIIRRSDNRVDLVFEVVEGRTVEVERLSFTGNREFSDRRLRRVLETKQAGIFRALIRSDTFLADRIEFDKQVLQDFYQSRGYVDFETLSVNSQLTRERDGYLVTFNVREGQQFKFGEITAVSDLEDVNPDEYLDVIRLRPGVIYNPALVDNTIARMERLALQQGLNFIRVEPRIIRNDRALTLDVEFAITRGPRVFVERIDIEGNTTTLDRVVRRQFRVIEGDPFNPREIRASASRIRALGFFSNAEVNAREGSGPDRVIIDVDVEEQPTGSLNFGGSFSNSNGFGAAISFTERNFLGRGQTLGFGVNTTSSTRSYNFNFVEPAFLGRDLRAGILIDYRTTDRNNADFNSRVARVQPSLRFPVGENSFLTLRGGFKSSEIFDVDDDSSVLLQAEEEEGERALGFLGYSFSYDSRRTGLNPNAGVIFRFSQDFAGLGGDNSYIETTALLGAETRVMNEEVTLRATLEGGALNMLSGDSLILDRFRVGPSRLRGFESNGIGPRDLDAKNEDVLGGNFFAVARLEAEFPLGLPEEYGVSGGVFYDMGSLWGLDNTDDGRIDDSFSLRSAVGVSLFWDTGLGPLRFNFAEAIQKEDFDEDQFFDLTISTQF
ncbi:outer membrane protein assembly factor BamA [Cognatishimia sp. MH4019]|uniref:outer membrane protein assembly factor BamA n=1 Tax=Cognatishimia sp. MH4019 TaxID=2854030 RepID=UPI001CD49A05|nr:outer membrane protein assembly factor BamA [Cognatishimia sp. MH4019]